MATSKPSLKIELRPGLLRQLRSLDKAEKKEIGALLERVRLGFGNPHLHQGAGIRDMGRGIYECRLDLHRRLVFSVAKGFISFQMMGNHDQVRRFIKGL